jgi:5-deoxy-glucuronate isomerase
MTVATQKPQPNAKWRNRMSAPASTAAFDAASCFSRFEKKPGRTQIASNPCALLGFEVVRLAKGAAASFSMAADREGVMVMLAGKAKVTVGGVVFASVGGRDNVFAGLPHSVYLPRGLAVTVEAITACEAAVPTAPSTIDAAPYEITPAQVSTGTWGTLNFTRSFRQILVEPDGRPASSLMIGETITPSGNWSTYPAHKHEADAGAERFHEEIYYFRNSSPDGYGLIQHYSPERGYDLTHRAPDDSVIAIPHGYHTYVAAPGSHSYYLWALAGTGRTQGVAMDPKTGWVQKMVGLV